MQDKDNGPVGDTGEVEITNSLCPWLTEDAIKRALDPRKNLKRRHSELDKEEPLKPLTLKKEKARRRMIRLQGFL